MSRIKRTLQRGFLASMGVTIVGSLAMASAGLAQAAPGVGNWVQGRVTTPATVSSSSWAKGNAGTSTNPVLNYDFWFEALNGTVPGGVYVRWVKCGYTSTQDSASSVGGSAKSLGSGGGWLRTGTDFKKGTCAQNWVRAKTTDGRSKSFGYGAYFWYEPVA